MGSLGEDVASSVLSRKPQNIAIHTNPQNSLHVVQPEIPEPRPNECLVHVRATGICGSDVHFWKHGHIGDMVVVGENGLGHESAGVVIKAGRDVTEFQAGKSTFVRGLNPILTMYRRSSRT